MRIAQLAPTYERVPPIAYGGTESVVGLLTEALVQAGHEVTLHASGDSVTSARLRGVTPHPIRYGDPALPRNAQHVHLANAEACFLDARDGRYDVIHNHAGLEGMALAALSATPVLTTNHTEFIPETAPIWERYPWYHHALSAASSGTYPAGGRLDPIHNAIDVASFTFAPRGDGYLLFLGRFSPEKGAATAVEVARRAGRRLVLAGKVDPLEADYFATTIAPDVDGGPVRFVGEVGAAEKRRLLAGADALLFPIDWEEPFGLVMIEALASGTPVVAFRRGSVPEIVEHGRTGFVVDDVHAMVRALDHLGLISRLACRRAAEARFDVDRMLEDYLRAFEAIVAGGRRHDAHGRRPVPIVVQPPSRTSPTVQ
jgi:glycosyltransferase involved in cell wall biosynthesis